MASREKFPVLRTRAYRALDYCPKYVYRDQLNEEQAIINHSQSLATLASRGGLTPLELVANIEKKAYLEISYTASEAIEQITKIQWHPAVEKKDYSGWYRIEKDKELVRIAIAAATKRGSALGRKDREFLRYLSAADPSKCIYIPNRIRLIKICREKLLTPIDEELE